jgi:hypothetical protein
VLRGALCPLYLDTVSLPACPPIHNIAKFLDWSIHE